MTDPATKEYLVVVQCHIVKERCSGYFCEKAFQDRSGGFAVYPKDKPYRTLYMTCGGCCGRGVQRRLSHLAGKLKKHEGIEKKQIAVQLSSCITKDNHHAPPCPHLDYLRTIFARLELDVFDDTNISKMSECRRQEGRYRLTR